MPSTGDPTLKTIAVIAQKGGVGKTTLTVNLAVAASREGQSVAVVDLDPQATAASWGDRRTEDVPVVVSAQAARLVHVLAAAAEQDAELVLIDTPPRMEQGALAAARAADLVLIPCRPSLYDLETVQASLDLVRMSNPATALLCVLNGVPARGPRTDQARSVLEDLRVTVCAATLGQRVALDHAATLGQGVLEYEPGSKAATEVATVHAAVAAHLDQAAKIAANG